MAITPTGSPSWVRTNTHETYGGNVNKTNYLSKGVIDALTDVGAEGFCRMASDLAAVQRTAPFGVVTCQCNDSSPAEPTVLSAFLMSGVRTTSYAGNAAPAGFPSAARNGNGDISITFASSYTDDYGVAGALAPTQCLATVQGTSACYVTCNFQSTVARARAYNGSSVSLVDPIITVTVW